jgi:hypothetical protein
MFSHKLPLIYAPLLMDRYYTRVALESSVGQVAAGLKSPTKCWVLMDCRKKIERTVTLADLCRCSDREKR